VEDFEADTLVFVESKCEIPPWMF